MGFAEHYINRKKLKEYSIINIKELTMEKEKFLVEVSARHVHLFKADVEALFGPGAKLTFKRDLSQPLQFLSEERVDVVGPKSSFKNVAILGPERQASQVEISLTDSFALGVQTLVRESGDTAGTPGIVIKGPNGEIELKNGVIVAKRHVHMSPEDAARLGVKDKQIVEVRVATGRSLTFGDVVVRVNPNFKLSMHVDTDEANAALIGRDGCEGYIVQ
jgi:propanediol utilization protein